MTTADQVGAPPAEARAGNFGPPARHPPPLGAVGPSDDGQSSDGRAGHGTYGLRVARHFHLDVAPTLTTTKLKTAQMAATRLTSGARPVGVTSPIPAENAYLVTLHLREAGGAELWKGGRVAERGPLREGSIDIVSLEDEPVYHLPQAFDGVQFYIPEIVFDELADDYGAPRAVALAARYGTPDPMIHQLGRALLPVLEDPRHASPLFFDHIAFAVHAHLATHYGQHRERPIRAGGRLAPWQVRVAKELLVADLAEEPPIADIARACQMPAHRFVRAFRRTTGMPPHRWLRAVRVERAKELLFTSPLSLAQIAYDCGFADQSHFTRAFAAAIGTSPGAWRRTRRG